MAALLTDMLLKEFETGDAARESTIFLIMSITQHLPNIVRIFESVASVLPPSEIPTLRLVPRLHAGHPLEPFFTGLRQPILRLHT